MTDCKKPTAGFWITVALVAALVGYPLSYGPAEWMYARGWLPRATGRTLMRIHFPMIWLQACGPDPVQEAIAWYARVGKHH